jgi:hypothetical protein
MQVGRQLQSASHAPIHPYIKQIVGDKRKRGALLVFVERIADACGRPCEVREKVDFVVDVVIVDEFQTVGLGITCIHGSYNGKLPVNDALPISGWQQIKKPYKKLMSLLLDGSFHVIICGREGVVMEQDEDGEMRVTGTKLKAEGETPHEPHLLGHMCPERDEKGGYIIKIFFEKDRSGVLTGKEFRWPTYETIAPVINYLCGGDQGKIGTQEEAAERDISAQEAEEEKAERERKELFEQIRTALLGAKKMAQLQTAWSLTNGKKTRLGDELFTQL